MIAVDDDPSRHTRVMRTLGRSVDVVTHKDPCDALLAIGNQKPDAVVMSMKMATFDGVHCISRIRAREDLRHTRIVVFSAHGSERKASIDAGVSAFVLKPATEELDSK